MSYAIFRMQKVHTNNIGNLEMHNERKTNNHSNKDINIELSKNNVQLIECKSYKKAIQKNIDKYYKSDRNIRKDAVIAVETIFTSDYEFFKNKTDKEKELFFEKSLEFLKEFVGEENIIAATIHYDETTPHMHCVFTPIDNDGKLKYKSFVSHKNDLVKLQDNYHEKVSQVFPELERGKSAKETKRKNLSVEEFKIITKVSEKDLKKVTNFRKNLEYLESYFPITEDKKFFNSKVKFNQEDVKKIRDFLNSLKTEIVTSEKILEENLTQKETLKKWDRLINRQENDISKKNLEIYELKTKNFEIAQENEKNKKIIDVFSERYSNFKEKFEEIKKELYPEKYNSWIKKKEKDRGNGWER